jgi:hypothetical protein
MIRGVLGCLYIVTRKLELTRLFLKKSHFFEYEMERRFEIFLLYINDDASES